MSKQRRERDVTTTNQTPTEPSKSEQLKELTTESRGAHNEVRRHSIFAIDHRQDSDEPYDGGWLAI